MKIYLSDHELKTKSFVGAQEIPLAYIDTKDASYEVEIRPFDDFTEDAAVQVRPYHVVASENTILFDEDLTPIKDVVFRRNGNAYCYAPHGMKEFTPSTFSCSVLIKRQAEYRSEKIYNLKIGTAEKDATLPLSDKLIRIFGDAYRRGAAPPNIKINNGAVTKESMIESAGTSADFVFVETEDGENFSGLDIDSVLKKNINVWISSSQWKTSQREAPPATFRQEGALNAFYLNSKRKKPSRVLFRDDTRMHGIEGEYSLLYEDVMLIEKKNMGFIIVTPQEFLLSSADNAKVIYDVLMYVYFRSYRRSSAVSSWITDEEVDYAAYSMLRIGKHHRSIRLDNMINSVSLGEKYQLVSIDVANPDVQYVGIDGSQELLFRKTGKKSADPKKESDTLSYLTTKNTIVLHKRESAYDIKTRVSVIGKQIPGGLSVVVSPIRDSNRCIYTDKEQELIIPDIKFVWYICTKPGSPYLINELTLVEQSEYSMEKHGHRIAEVRTKASYHPKLIDMRVRGGGLPTKENPGGGIDLIDIGNLYGKPYRLGSTVIIRLPKVLQKHEKKIKDAVLKHIAAGEYPIFIFE